MSENTKRYGTANQTIYVQMNKTPILSNLGANLEKYSKIHSVAKH